MKVRKGFVSNSSSSSFVCDVCNENVSGMDMGLFEAEMFECVGGHTICDDHKVEKEVDFNDLDFEGKRAHCLELAGEGSVKEDILEAEDEEDLDIIYDELSEENRYNKPKSSCPVCQLKTPTNEQVLQLLLFKANMTRKDVVKEIQKFSDYDDMCKRLGL